MPAIRDDGARAMRVLSRADFLKMPAGTLYQAVDRLDDMLENGASYPMDASYGRDGCFNEADLFLVFERADLVQLGKIVDQAILVAE